jgi:PAS domain S-box-containing protein
MPDLVGELLNRAPVGIAVLDPELRYTFINPALAEINGSSVDEHIGRSLEEVIPELAPHVRQPFERVLKTGTPLLDWELRGETRALPGETRVWIENIYPLFETNAIAALGVVIIDVTDRRRAEHRLRKEQDRASRLLRQLELGLLPVAGPPKRWSAPWRYRSAHDEMLLGGDFVGVSERPDGSLEFVIGDVAGRGPSAAGLGAALRSGWKALVEAGVAPADLIAALDRMIRDYVDRGTFATVCCGRVSSTTRKLEVISAGHHPPLRLTPEICSPLELDLGPVLGVVSGTPTWPTNTVHVDPDQALLLFTDGAFEFRLAGSRERWGYAGLAGEVPIELLTSGDVEAGLDELLGRIEAASEDQLNDDVALLLIK